MRAYFACVSPREAVVTCLCSFRRDWLLAMKYAEILYKESKWSKVTYCYQKACFFMMCEQQTEAIANHVSALFTYVCLLFLYIISSRIPLSIVMRVCTCLKEVVWNVTEKFRS